MEEFDIREALSKLTTRKSKLYVKASIESYRQGLIDAQDLMQDYLKPSIDLCDKILNEIKDI